MTFAASGTMQCACTSTVLMRFPAMTTSQRRCACACACAPLPPPELAAAPAVISHPTNAIVPGKSPLFGISLPLLDDPKRRQPTTAPARKPAPLRARPAIVMAASYRPRKANGRASDSAFTAGASWRKLASRNGRGNGRIGEGPGMSAIKMCVAAVAVAVLFAPPVEAQQRSAAAQRPMAQPAAPQAANQAAATDPDTIGGTVTSRFGPEAGVWVIAETRDLGTRFAKSVVTDERGRYVIPDLPKAKYQVWVRGYGLVDSPKVAAEPGKILDLTAAIAPDLATAAQYYPAAYWYSMLKIPDKSRFPGTGDKGNGIPENFKAQEQWLNFIKTNGCGNCNQMGNYATRTISDKLGKFESSQDAWSYRLSVGPAGHDMVRFITQLMTPEGGQLAALADWTDRIKAGELPARSPPRPVGVERNLVITVRDWLDPKHYLHDLTTTDRRKPTVNANGPIYGDTELSSNAQPVLDPVRNVKATIQPPVRDGTPSSALVNPVVNPSPYFDMEQTWDSKVNAHTSAMDQDGRVYWAAQNRSPRSEEH